MGTDGWQEFNWNGKKVGAPVFIVNVTQSPNISRQVNEREMRSVWNQACLVRYVLLPDFTVTPAGQQQGVNGKALLSQELAFPPPQKDGLFMV